MAHEIPPKGYSAGCDGDFTGEEKGGGKPENPTTTLKALRLYRKDKEGENPRTPLLT